MNKGYLYKFQFETLTKWEGGTDGDVYLQIGDRKPQIQVEPLGQLQVSFDTIQAGASGSSLELDVDGPLIEVIE